MRLKCQMGDTYDVSCCLANVPKNIMWTTILSGTNLLLQNGTMNGTHHKNLGEGCEKKMDEGLM